MGCLDKSRPTHPSERKARSNMPMKTFINLMMLLLLAVGAEAQTVNQSFTVTWDHDGVGQTGFRVERMPAGGTFAVVDTVSPDVREYRDMVSGSPGDTFSWRVVAVNSTQTSPYSNVATATIPSVATPPPPAPSVAKVVRNKNQCTFTLTGSAPDQLGGWTVQYKYSSAPTGSVLPFSSPDTTSPYSVAGTLKNGSYDFWGTWTKSGQPTLQSAHAPGSCP
jgi:hypothetical protein